ncbi:MAG TPA: hypothetical protein VFX98_15220 [Longimicrobiaceae bacterium]|nr:hypothetical protein [Longimicrobiaceae bacterium]
MAKRQLFKPALWSDRFQASYAALSSERQRQCDSAVIALIKGESSPGLRIKPIKPDKHFNEARINEGDRVVFREEGGTLYFVDIVKHDDIGRYGRKPRASP